jgi:two-component system, LytTR family, sensor kinase
MKLSAKAVKIVPFIGAAIGWGIFHAWILNRQFGFEIELAVWDALNSVACLMLSCALLYAVISKYTPKVGRYQFVIGLAFVVAILCNWASYQVFDELAKQNEKYMAFLGQSSLIRLAILFLILAGWAVSLLFAKQIRDLMESTAHQSTTDAMVREAELQKLQLQLQPHFLFNSLNSINALILINPPKAREMVQQLSDFLRSTLRRADEHWITLEQELDYLQLYLSIEKVRFGHRLDVQIDFDEQIKLWLIPPLLIQPLVENAIKFGLYGTTDKVVISIQTKRVNDLLQIEITNPFDSDMQPAEGTGFGLNGLKRRLYLLYTRNDLLNTTIENNQFTVQLTLPEKI